MVEEEDQKEQEKLRKQSSDRLRNDPPQQTPAKPNQPQPTQFEPQSELKRQFSEYNLNKSLETSTKRLPNNDLDSPVFKNKDPLNTEESSVKITKS